MEKPTAVVAEMYELFGVELRPRYRDRGSSTSSATDCKDESDDEDISIIQQPSLSEEVDELDEEEVFSIELPASFIKKINKAPVRFETPIASGRSSLAIRDRKRAREEGKLPTILKIAKKKKKN